MASRERGGLSPACLSALRALWSRDAAPSCKFPGNIDLCLEIFMLFVRIQGTPAQMRISRIGLFGPDGRDRAVTSRADQGYLSVIMPYRFFVVDDDREGETSPSSPRPRRNWDTAARAARRNAETLTQLATSPPNLVGRMLPTFLLHIIGAIMTFFGSLAAPGRPRNAQPGPRRRGRVAAYERRRWASGRSSASRARRPTRFCRGCTRASTR